MPAPLPDALPADRVATYGAGVHTGAHDLTETTVNGLRDALTGLDGATVAEHVAARVLYDPRDYGAELDARRRGGATTAGATTTVTVPGAGFGAADIGKHLIVYNATVYGAPRTITAVNSATEVTLSAASGVTTSGAATDMAVWGTDDSTAFNAALTAAGAAAVYDATLGDNLPAGSGHPTVIVPAVNSGGAIIAAALTVPDGVGFDAGQAMLYNLLASRTAPCMTIGRFTAVGELTWQLCGGGGVVWGTAATQCHGVARRVALWNPGSAVTALTLRGYHHELPLFWIKGGLDGIHFDGSSDDVVEGYCVGTRRGVRITQGNNIRVRVRGDTVQGTQAQGAAVLTIDDNSRNIQADVQAFIITDQTLDTVVAVGQNSVNKNHNLRINMQAGRTGGNLVRLANCAQSRFTVDGSNYADALNWGQPITVGVSYGAGVDADVKVEMALPTSGVTPTAGTVAGHCTVLIGESRRHLAQSAATNVVTGRAAADAASRWAITAGGTLNFGDGTAAADTNLYRHSAGNALATDDDFRFTTVGKGPFVKDSTGKYWRLDPSSTGLPRLRDESGVLGDVSGGEAGPFVTAASFGAVGDGVTDDRAALQAALDSLTAGGTLLLAAGTYQVTAPLNWDHDKTRIIGAGREATTVRSTTGPVMNIGSTGAALSKFHMEGVQLSAQQADADVVVSSFGFNQGTFIDCTFRTVTGNGQVFKMVNVGVFDVVWEGCWIYRPGGTTAAFFYEGVGQFNANTIKNCRIQTPGSTDYAVRLQETSGSALQVLSNTIRDNNFEETNGGAVYLRGGRGNVIERNGLFDLHVGTITQHLVHLADTPGTGGRRSTHNVIIGLARANGVLAAGIYDIFIDPLGVDNVLISTLDTVSGARIHLNSSRATVIGGGQGATVDGLDATKTVLVNSDNFRTARTVVGSALNAALPDYTFAGDEDTGMYRVAANDLGLAVNGVRELRIQPGKVIVPNALQTFGGLGFYGASVAAKPTVTGSRGGNAAVASLITALATVGLVTDSSSV